MITKELIAPKSIVVVGGSDDVHKPGGATLKNLLDTHYSGELYVVNPKCDSAQGVKSYRDIEQLPSVDCAILAIPAKTCLATVETLCNKKTCKAIIILSAGFKEDSAEGAEWERKITEVCNSTNTALIGPNCVGVMTSHYIGAFIQPIPKISSPVIMLYIESMNNPAKLAKHAKSLIAKGAKIAAIKAGYSEAGSRAASSHTGAMASPDKAVNALFRKTGIVRCYSRTELVTVAAAMMYPEPNGRKVAIVTHAGGPAVMQTDVLSSNGIEIPRLSGPKAQELLARLYLGSSTANPIDFLATGTAEQLGYILDACENDFDVDAITIIFGNPGLSTVYDVYDLISEKIRTSKKPIYPVLPSIVNARNEIEAFHDKGGISFPDEVALGSAIVKIMNRPRPIEDCTLPPVDKKMIREVIDANPNGYLAPDQVQLLLDAAGINRSKEYVVSELGAALEAAKEIKYPVVMKVVGPIHKSDVGGVSLNITDDTTLSSEFYRMMRIKDATGVLLQPMLSGTEIFVGAKREDKFGHLILCGLGGIYVEALHDINCALSPVSTVEADEMIRGLRAIKLLEGIRGKEGVNLTLFNEVIRRVSALCAAAPEIFEMDINPLLGNSKSVTAVDARIRIEKSDISK